MKKILLVIILISLLFLAFLFSPQPDPKTEVGNSSTIENRPQQTKSITASFAIFTNGTFRVFTASMYHNLSEDVYIEASSPNIVIVEKEGIIWDDFFKTLPMSLTPDCLTTGTGQKFCSNNIQTLKFYINGERTVDALNRVIKSGDQLLVSYGNETDLQIKEQIERAF